MKRFLYIFLCAVMAFSLFIPTGAGASRAEVDSITTPHVILIEAETGAVLFEKGARSKAYPASTTKIMTCLVALENCSDINTVYTCGNESVNGFGSQSSLLGLKPGYSVTIKDMLYGLMLCSGNDCGACLAVATSGTMDAFIELMNAKAQELGMADTHYTNAHGLHNEDHYTTAYDMAILMRYALENETFRRIAKTVEYTVNEKNGKFSKTIYTSNKLLYKKDTDTEDNRYPYAIAGKTGETNYAGYCFVGAAEKDGVTLITVLLGDNNMGGTSPSYRFKNAKKLFNYGFDQYVSYDMKHFNVPYLFDVQTLNYDPDDPEKGVITASVDLSEVKLAGLKTELADVTEADFRWETPSLDTEAITAPVHVGDVLGTVTLYYKDEPFFTGELVSGSEVKEKRTAPGTETQDPGETSAPTYPSDTGYLYNPFDPNSPYGAIDPDDPESYADPGTSKNLLESSRRGVCDLTVSKNGGEPEYTLWIYDRNTLYTRDDKNNKYYNLFCDGDVYRSAQVPGASYTLLLFERVESEFGEITYEYRTAPKPDGTYVIVSLSKKAMSSSKSGRTLRAVGIEFDENGNIISEITGDMLWTFKENGIGYNLVSNGKYLHRSGGNPLLVWILIGVLAIGLGLVIYLLATGKSRRRNPMRKGKYKIYRM